MQQNNLSPNNITDTNRTSAKISKINRKWRFRKSSAKTLLRVQNLEEAQGKFCLYLGVTKTDFAHLRSPRISPTFRRNSYWFRSEKIEQISRNRGKSTPVGCECCAKNPPQEGWEMIKSIYIFFRDSENAPKSCHDQNPGYPWIRALDIKGRGYLIWNNFILIK